jgi:choline dehydrogenase-like flavoprotein
MTRKGKAIGVEVTDAETNEVMEFYSKIIFLNASTFGTTFILLNSILNRFPNGLGNGSDQVGRNLMDHHKQADAQHPWKDLRISITSASPGGDVCSALQKH